MRFIGQKGQIRLIQKVIHFLTLIIIAHSHLSLSFFFDFRINVLVVLRQGEVLLEISNVNRRLVFYQFPYLLNVEL